MKIKIEEAIRKTLVIENKASIPLAVDKIYILMTEITKEAYRTGAWDAWYPSEDNFGSFLKNYTNHEKPRNHN